MRKAGEILAVEFGINSSLVLYTHTTHTPSTFISSPLLDFDFNLLTVDSIAGMCLRAFIHVANICFPGRNYCTEKVKNPLPVS